MFKLILPVALSVVLYYVWSGKKPASQMKEPKDLLESYDYIVVGGGTAGNVVAARLSEDPSVTVLLLEAGYEETDFKYTKYPPSEKQLELTEFDWQFTTVPQTKCCESAIDRKLLVPRAKGLGGCSSHYGAAHVRATREDYDYWRKLGNKGWGFEDILPYYAKIEDLQIDRLKSQKHHGTGGPFRVIEATPTPLTEALMEAVKNRGYRWRDDLNGIDDEEGFGLAQLAIGNGERESSATRYLRPAIGRPNLHAMVHAYVTKILFTTTKNKKPRAVGVEFVRHGIKMVAKAKKEVIVSGGAINSPQLLMLSGIGDKKHLTDLGIPVLIDNPAVGKNLKDHPFSYVVASLNESVGWHGVSPDNKISYALAELQWHLFRTGPLASVPIEMIGFTRSGLANESWTDIELYFITVEPFRPYSTVNWNEKAIAALNPPKPTVSRMAVFPILVHPHSVGELRLQSADPFDKPILDPKHLEDERDLEILLKGMKQIMEITKGLETERFNLQWHEQHAPGCEKHKLWSDEYLKCHIRSRLLALYHPVSTCRMGAANENSVVDDRLRVHGVDGLRVIDASIFPEQVTANTNAPVLVVAEKGADLIKEDNAKKARRFYQSEEDDEFMLSFEQRTLPFDSWTHQAHLRMAWNYITKFGLTKARELIKHGIRHYNEANKNRINRGYHETVTEFYIHMVTSAINHQKAANSNDDYNEFITKHNYLLERDLVFKYYSNELLSSAKMAQRIHRGRTYSYPISTANRFFPSHYRSAPFGVNNQAELRSWADDDYVGDLPHEYWPNRLLYCDVYKRKWIGYSQMHKYWKNPFGWERGLPRYSIAYPHAGWRSFKRYRYVINPPLIRVP